MIDRIAPTKRPEGQPSDFQQWRSLLFLHWAVPVEVLRPLVPDPLDLDLYDGVAYVGVVPFAMQGVRPRWLPSWLALSFLETNVRTYVTHNNQPGVYFLSLEAASRLAVFAARQLWGLPYFYARMSSTSAGGEIHYRSVRRRSGVFHDVRYRIGDPLGELKPHTIDFYFLERYLLFVHRGKQTFVGQVHHRPYPAHAAEVTSVEDQLIAAAGISDCDGPPAFAHYSPGVDVEVFALRPV